MLSPGESLIRDGISHRIIRSEHPFSKTLTLSHRPDWLTELEPTHIRTYARHSWLGNDRFSLCALWPERVLVYGLRVMIRLRRWIVELIESQLRSSHSASDWPLSSSICSLRVVLSCPFAPMSFFNNELREWSLDFLSKGHESWGDISFQAAHLSHKGQLRGFVLQPGLPNYPDQFSQILIWNA